MTLNKSKNPEKMERPCPWPDPPDRGPAGNTDQPMAKNTDENTAKNTNIELWRQNPDDYHSPSIHVTKDGKIGIDVKGSVLVASVEQWHKAGNILFPKLFER